MSVPHLKALAKYFCERPDDPRSEGFRRGGFGFNLGHASVSEKLSDMGGFLKSGQATSEELLAVCASGCRGRPAKCRVWRP